MQETGMRRGDLIATKTKLEIHPLPVMKCLGIDKYSIDEKNKTVYVSRGDLARVAGFFDYRLFKGSVGFTIYGWTYKITDKFRQALAELEEDKDE